MTSCEHVKSNACSKQPPLENCLANVGSKATHQASCHESVHWPVNRSQNPRQIWGKWPITEKSHLPCWESKQKVHWTSTVFRPVFGPWMTRNISQGNELLSQLGLETQRVHYINSCTKQVSSGKGSTCIQFSGMKLCIFSLLRMYLCTARCWSSWMKQGQTAETLSERKGSLRGKPARSQKLLIS